MANGVIDRFTETPVPQYGTKAQVVPGSQERTARLEGILQTAIGLPGGTVSKWQMPSAMPGYYGSSPHSPESEANSGNVELPMAGDCLLPHSLEAQNGGGIMEKQS